ncbi:MAG TPA: TolC family protein [Candidatus Sphingobacterium stercoripullorum]|nr:TolC family protein [Candidatus Sphingobacterium stercoripullorum]
MNVINRFILTGLFLAVVFGKLQAQETLTLQQAIKFALENKAEAKTSKLEVENAESIINETRSAALPQLNAVGDINYNPILQKSPLPAEIFGGEPGEVLMVSFGQKWQSTATLALNQQLFNQTVFTGLKAAKSTREFYQINQTLTEEQLIEKVANGYYDVYTTRLQLATLDNNLNNTTKTQGVISGLVENGLAKQIDLDRIVVAIKNLQAQRQQLISALDLKENALKFIIGMNIETEIELPEESFDIKLAQYSDTSNINRRTEIQLLEKQSEMLELNKKAKLSEYYPSLALTANYGYLGFGNSFPIFSKDKGVQWSNFSGIGLSLSVPIFNGGATKARVQQAEIDIQKARFELEDTKLALSLANENAKTQIKNTLITINSNRENVDLAKKDLEDTENNYKNGLATLTDLLDAETAYADAQNNLNTSLLDYKIAEIQLIKANGELKSLVEE